MMVAWLYFSSFFNLHLCLGVPQELDSKCESGDQPLRQQNLELLIEMMQIMSLLVDLAKGGHDNRVRSYISWEDLKVDEQSLALKSNNDVRVIMVDQHGRGHSKTVQGAVDMLPDHTTQRVNIYIFPGVYREKVLVPKTKPYVSL
uniref:pectinesterase n=1 Tax=Lotus japonicus TaxID=34305 RepID=I3SQF7_LOTJA|nr:unknown [Lotus japonicus]